MAARRTVALLALLGTVLLASECAADCRSAEFKCKDGQCMSLIKKCTGVPECRDKSDEGPSECYANTFIVPDGKNMTVRIDYQKELGYIEFHMCNADSCGHIDLHGVEKSGRFSSMHVLECNNFGRKCKKSANRIGASSFDSGTLDFVLQLFKGR